MSNITSGVGKGGDGSGHSGGGGGRHPQSATSPVLKRKAIDFSPQYLAIFEVVSDFIEEDDCPFTPASMDKLCAAMMDNHEVIDGLPPPSSGLKTTKLLAMACQVKMDRKE